MDAAEYKHVVLGLVFLKYISDAFEARRVTLAADLEADPEDPDEYVSAGAFWVPKEARWERLRAAAKSPGIGVSVDKAMDAIERDNHRLKGVLPKDYARPTLDKTRLGELIDLISDVGLGEDQDRSRDILGRAYEYFLGQFASREGKKAGEFYTPRCVVKLLVEMIEPYQGRVYDPCCGSSGMFVQSEEFIRAHGGRLTDISVFGQESNPTTWKLAKMNLAIRGIEANLGSENADTFTRDLHPDLRADFILANPPFNMKEWGQERVREDVRWRFGVPPTGNANFAWLQHIVYHLGPTGIAGLVLANGSTSTDKSGQGEIRRKLIEADLVDCVVALPGQLFYGTGIPACLWFLARNRAAGDMRRARLRDRRGSVLVIDARSFGVMVTRVHRELTERDISTIAATYHSWRVDDSRYVDVPGFCRSISMGDLANSRFIVTPARHVGSAPRETDRRKLAHEVASLIDDLETNEVAIGAMGSSLTAALRRITK
jgi:type I restriction enzyme M protein